MWHNMREEVCIYINGRPYVLREEERPFKNMQVCVLAITCKQCTATICAARIPALSSFAVSLCML